MNNKMLLKVNRPPKIFLTKIIIYLNGSESSDIRMFEIKVFFKGFVLDLGVVDWGQGVDVL